VLREVAPQRHRHPKAIKVVFLVPCTEELALENEIVSVLPLRARNFIKWLPLMGRAKELVVIFLGLLLLKERLMMRTFHEIRALETCLSLSESPGSCKKVRIVHL
jgi:hypothetical protein